MSKFFNFLYRNDNELEKGTQMKYNRTQPKPNIQPSTYLYFLSHPIPFPNPYIRNHPQKTPTPNLSKQSPKHPSDNPKRTNTNLSPSSSSRNLNIPTRRTPRRSLRPCRSGTRISWRSTCIPSTSFHAKNNGKALERESSLTSTNRHTRRRRRSARRHNRHRRRPTQNTTRNPIWTIRHTLRTRTNRDLIRRIHGTSNPLSSIGRLHATITRRGRGVETFQELRKSG